MRIGASLGSIVQWIRFSLAGIAEQINDAVFDAVRMGLATISRIIFSLARRSYFWTMIWEVL